MENVRRVLVAMTAVVVVVAAGVAIGAVAAIRKPIPDTEGVVRLTGIDRTVTISRDRFGVPNITADTTDDLFFAQGFVHAQDRFHEMDVRRHVAAGDLSALVGHRGAGVDRLVRALRLPETAERDEQKLPTSARRALDAYALGVNAYIGGKAGSALSLEYTAKTLIGRDYRPDPWTPLNSIEWAGLLDWSFAGPVTDEIDRTMIARHMKPMRVGDLYPGFDMRRSVAETSPAAFRSPDVQPILGNLRHALAEVPRVTGLPSPNATGAWLTGSGTADVTLTAQVGTSVSLPGPWYQVGLHCRRVSSDCPFDVSGMSLSGMPGVVVGHNRTTAWALGMPRPSKATVAVVERSKKARGAKLARLPSGESFVLRSKQLERRPSIAGILELNRAADEDDVAAAADRVRLPFSIVYSVRKGGGEDGDSGEVPETIDQDRPALRSSLADLLVPSLLPLSPGSDFTAEGKATLDHWNRKMSADAPGAAYFAAVWRNVLAMTFHDELPREQWPDGRNRWKIVIRWLLAHPHDTWWDNLATPDVVENRDDILRQSMAEARDELTRLRARDVREWNWASLHEVTLRNPTLDGRLFQRGPVQLTGSGETRESTGWDAAVGYATAWAPTARLVMKVAKPDESRWSVSTGSSGHAFASHYTDQVPMWARGTTSAWPFTPAAVQKSTVRTLKLMSPTR
jgi:acyl-homoserine lactone acylase PvdQ